MSVTVCVWAEGAQIRARTCATAHESMRCGASKPRVVFKSTSGEGVGRDGGKVLRREG